LRTGFSLRPNLLAAFSTILVLIAAGRIVLSYSHTAQAFDEPCHVAAGMEFLDNGTYILDAVHPTLARIAIALPLYLAGERYPALPVEDPGSGNYNVVGNHVLYDSGHFHRNLILARLGVLPFFLLGAFVVYLWTRDIGGHLAAVIAVFLYTTTPTILAFSSIAYTDIVAAATQLTAMFTFCRWLQRPDLRRTIVLGFALGIAFLAKLTTVLFVPAATLAIAVVWYARERKKPSRVPFATVRLLAALALAAVVIWAGYRFSLRPLQEATGINPASMPSFQHFPRSLRATAQAVVLRNPRLPAPELLHGVALAWALDQSPSPSYLFGHLRSGGWWYFFLVGLGAKLPLPLLLLFAAAVVVLLRHRETGALFPIVALGAVLLITFHVSYQVGIRHILIAVPLITIVAGLGIGSLLQRANWRSSAGMAVIVLLGWQAAESGSAQSDFLAYFNQLAGKDPSSVLVTGCDLDCGQDLFRLARELHARNTTECTLLVWSSADIARSDLPPNGSDNSSDVHGCVALSSRAFRLGDVLHHSYGPGYFSWLNNYQPVAIVGRTIRLYEITRPLETKGSAADSKSMPSVRKF
jgi:hypothetical protein